MADPQINAPDSGINPLADWPIESLHYSLRRQTAPGVSTWGHRHLRPPRPGLRLLRRLPAGGD